MSTNNAINSAFPIDTSSGGTGNLSLNSGGVLIGSGTGAITDLSFAGTGKILTSLNALSDPKFDVNVEGDFSFTSSTSGASRTLTIKNTDNTNSSSSGKLWIQTDNGGGDPSIRYTVTGSQTWSQGVDNSDSDKFNISASSAVETTTVFSSTVAGEIIKPLTPAFGAVAADQTNVTGGGTVYTVTFTSAEYFDQGSDFDGTSTFTAPITGKYVFNATITFAGIGADKPHVQVRLNTSNRLYNPGISSLDAKRDANNRFCGYYSFIVDMDAADTAKVDSYVWSSGSDDVDILGSGTFFNGYLAC